MQRCGNITAEEVQIAIKMQKLNKATGLDEIQAELLKYDGPNVVMKFVDLLNACWRTQAVSKDWQKGTVIKLPKKGNTMECIQICMA